MNSNSSNSTNPDLVKLRTTKREICITNSLICDMLKDIKGLQENNDNGSKRLVDNIKSDVNLHVNIAMRLGREMDLLRKIRMVTFSSDL